MNGIAFWQHRIVAIMPLAQTHQKKIPSISPGYQSEYHFPSSFQRSLHRNVLQKVFRWDQSCQHPPDGSVQAVRFVLEWCLPRFFGSTVLTSLGLRAFANIFEYKASSLIGAEEPVGV